MTGTLFVRSPDPAAEQAREGARYERERRLRVKVATGGTPTIEDRALLRGWAIADHATYPLCRPSACIIYGRTLIEAEPYTQTPFAFVSLVSPLDAPARIAA